VANTDLSSQFEKISDHAKAATQHLRAAGQHTKDQLAADAASAREKATAASNQLKENADDSRNKVSSHWQSHVAEMRARAQEKADRFDAGVTAMDADMAESYALDAIDFAQDAVDEAESAVLDAMYTRADAEALRT
jgi:hypothetical protein